MLIHIISTLILFLLASSIFADTTGVIYSDCFKRLEKEKVVDGLVTVFTNDSTVVHGRRPIVNSASSILYMKLITDPYTISDITIPFSRIERITCRKPSPARWGLPLLGLGFGATFGAFVGAALAPEEKGWLDFSGVASAFFGGLVGGLIGMAGGHAIGKNMSTEVTLHCR